MVLEENQSHADTLTVHSRVRIPLLGRLRCAVAFRTAPQKGLNYHESHSLFEHDRYVHIHPCYDGRNFSPFQKFVTDSLDNDFALVILKEPLPDYVKPVKLNRDNHVPSPGEGLYLLLES